MAYLNKNEGSEVMPVATDPSTGLPYKLRVGQPVELTNDGVVPYTGAGTAPVIGFFVTVGNIYEAGSNNGGYFSTRQPQISGSLDNDAYVTVATPSEVVFAAECDGNYGMGTLVGYDPAQSMYVPVTHAPASHATGIVLHGIPQGKAIADTMHRIMAIPMPFKP